MRPEEEDIEVTAETDSDMRRGGAGHGDAEHKVNKLKDEIEHIKKERQEYLDGWQEDISSAKVMEDLPQEAQDYVHALEEMAGAPISAIGVGPGRDQTIQVRPLSE